MGAPVFGRVGQPVLVTLKFMDPNNGNAAVTGKVYADLQNVVLGYYTSAGTRTTVTASSYLTLTEEGTGEYRLAFTPPVGYGDRWWFLHFVYPTGTQVLRMCVRMWIADTQIVLRADESIYYDIYMEDANGSAVTGKVLADFQGRDLNSVDTAGTQTDRDSLLVLTEVGSGYYTMSIAVPSGATGSWSMYLIEPTGTMEYEHAVTWGIFAGDFADRVQELVADRAGHVVGMYPSAFANSLTDALKEYSGMIPRLRHYVMAGDGSSYEVAVSSLTGWVSGCSAIVSIEYPAKSTSALNDTTRRAPEYLRECDWQHYDNGVTERIMLTNHTPASGYNAVFTYTALHTDSSTVPSGHLPWLYKLAASWVLQTAGNLAMQEMANFGNNVIADMQTRRDQYFASAKEFRDEAMEFFKPRAISAVGLKLSPG